MELLFKNSMKKYEDYFFFRHWEDRHEYINKKLGKEIKSEDKKVAEKSICTNTIKEIMQNQKIIKSKLLCLGIPETISSLLKRILMNIWKNFQKELH